MPLNACDEPVVSVVHAPFSNCTTVPFSPAAQATLAFTTQTALSARVVADVMALQVAPFHREIAPLVPTAITLLAVVPCTARKSLLVESDSDHVAPFQR